MMSREEKKGLTRHALMDAALDLVGGGENFASISLREVAKKAGVVPTSFYRHFRDMEELGLNIVDDLGMLLRKMMRMTRQQEGYVKNLTRRSIEVYADFVVRHRNYFFFLCQCRTGGTPAIRSAIRNELRFFASELASDIRQLPLLTRVDRPDLDMICQLIVATVAETTIDLLDLMVNNPDYHQEYVEQLQKKLRLIWLGAGDWRSGSLKKTATAQQVLN
jgi:AcrR family transcriptional regulator